MDVNQQEEMGSPQCARHRHFKCLNTRNPTLLGVGTARAWGCSHLPTFQAGSPARRAWGTEWGAKTVFCFVLLVQDPEGREAIVRWVPILPKEIPSRWLVHHCLWERTEGEPRNQTPSHPPGGPPGPWRTLGKPIHCFWWCLPKVQKQTGIRGWYLSLFSVAITKYHRLGNLWGKEVYLAHNSEGWEVKNWTAVCGKGPSCWWGLCKVPVWLRI